MQEAFACVGPIGRQRQHGRSHDCSCRHDREDQAQVVCQGVCHPRFPDAALLQEGRQEKCGSQPVSPPVSAGPHRPSPGQWLALSCPLPPSTDRDSAGSAPVSQSIATRDHALMKRCSRSQRKAGRQRRSTIPRSSHRPSRGSRSRRPCTRSSRPTGSSRPDLLSSWCRPFSSPS